MKKEIFLVPYAHLDTQWRWEFPTTIVKYIKRTLDKNIYLFEKHPEYVFNFTGAIRYAMMKEYYPEKFEKIKKYIKEGRWNVVGTCLDETDAIIPSVESMIRNILYGDRWAMEELGSSSRDYVIPDCFGFPANMPTILSHCDVSGFSTQKLKWGSAVGIPFEIGIWKGPDGSELVCALNPGPYNSHIILPIHLNRKRLNKLKKQGKKTGIWKSYQYYGVGDIGGAPTKGTAKRAIKSIKHCEKKDTWYRVRQGSSDQFFDELTTEEKEKLERYIGDLLLTHHSAGVLTSKAIMKRWNRKNELLGFAAEVAAVTAMIVAGARYPTEKIKSAWYKVIGNQMHDILPGTSTPIAYEYSQNDEVIALNTWSSILEDSAAVLAPYVKGDGEILLFNPLGESRKDVVDIELPNWNEENPLNAVALDADGKSLPVQIRKNEHGIAQTTFIPELAPFSWSRFSIKPIKDPKEVEIPDGVNLTSDENEYILENSCYKVKISRDGKIESIFQKTLEKELLKKPIAYEFHKEKPIHFPAWNMYWKDRKKEPFLRIEGGDEVSIIEKGPLRCTIQIIKTHHKSKFVRQVSLRKNSKIVEFTEHINWREKKCSLKLALIAKMNRPEITYNWETSRIKRGLNHKLQFEVPSRFWADMSEDDWGISLIEDSKYGWDHPHHNTLRMTLLYTPAIRLTTGFRDQKVQDWGEHTIRYGIFAHEGDFKQTDHFAKRLNQEIRSFLIKDDISSAQKQDISLLRVSSKQIGILAVKKAEDTEDIVIRVYERYGLPANAEIIFNSDIASVKEINGLEEIQQNLTPNGKKFNVIIEANEIRSYIVELKNKSNPLELNQEALKLEYNYRLIGEKSDRQIHFPADITPERVYSDSIQYNLAVEKNLNSLQCKGQKISIPEGHNTLSILISSKRDCDASFTWLDGNGNNLKEETHHVSAITGFLGQWDTLKWLIKPRRHLKYKRDYVWLNKCTGVDPGYVKRDRLEWYSTHTYEDGEVQHYHYGYLYTVNLEILKEARTLLLPDDSNIHILAMTASQRDIQVQNIKYMRDKYDF